MLLESWDVLVQTEQTRHKHLHLCTDTNNREVKMEAKPRLHAWVLLRGNRGNPGPYLLLQVGEGRLQQVGDVLLNVRLIVGWTGGAQSDADLPLLHQVEHVGQDAGVHGQTCTEHTPQGQQPLCSART